MEQVLVNGISIDGYIMADVEWWAEGLVSVPMSVVGRERWQGERRGTGE